MIIFLLSQEKAQKKQVFLGRQFEVKIDEEGLFSPVVS